MDKPVTGSRQPLGYHAACSLHCSFWQCRKRKLHTKKDLTQSIYFKLAVAVFTWEIALKVGLKPPPPPIFMKKVTAKKSDASKCFLSSRELHMHPDTLFSIALVASIITGLKWLILIIWITWPLGYMNLPLWTFRLAMSAKTSWKVIRIILHLETGSCIISTDKRV